MTVQNIEELIKENTTGRLPGLPWKVTFPLLATLDVDSFFTPEHSEEEGNPSGTSAAYGKGYGNVFKDTPKTNIPLTEDLMSVYYPEEGLKELVKLMRDKGWARPYGNPLFNLWGAPHQNLSNWKVAPGEGGRLQLYTIPMTLAFYRQLRPYFAPQSIEQMQEQGLEEVLFDTLGNALWVKNGVMTGVFAEGDPARFTVSGHKEIVGGTGRFKGATGAFRFAGYGLNRTPEREGEPTSTGRMGIWGTVEYWWPYPLQLPAGEGSEEVFRELVQPADIAQDNIIQQVISEKLAAGEIVVQ